MTPLSPNVTSPPTDADLARFRAIRAWIFDLDNTLYPRGSNLFPQVQQRIGTYVERRLGLPPAEAEKLQKDFYQRYGTTLKGLMVEHDVEPDEFLEFVHDIDHSVLVPDPELGLEIGRLPGRRFILTNGSRRHAEKVAERLGITRHFDDIFDVVWARHLPKPSPETYDRLIAETGVDPNRTAMFEDLSRNLLVPRQRGMTTILVVPKGAADVVEEAWEAEGRDADHIDFLTDDLRGFLGRINRAIESLR